VVAKSLDEGVFSFLNKPIERQTLLAYCRRALRLYQLKRENTHLHQNMQKYADELMLRNLEIDAISRIAALASVQRDLKNGREGEALDVVRDTLNADAVLLFTEKSGPYSWKPLLQYFLFPRTVVHCIDANLTACIESDLEDGGFVVHPEAGPGPEGIPIGAGFIPYRGEANTGLYQLSGGSGSGESGTVIP